MAPFAQSMFETLRKSVDMLSPKMRRRWLLLVPLAFTTGAAEMGAAAGIFAILALLTKGHPDRTVVVRMSLWLAAYYVAKTALTVAVEYVRVRVSHDASAELASGMLRRYLSAPYPFHFHRNSAELIRRCTESVEEALGGVLAASTAFVIDLLMGAGVIAVLIATSPWPALALGLALLLVMWGALRLTRRVATRHGSRSYEVSVSIVRGLQQALGAIKEVKVLGREQYFCDEFEERQRELRDLGYLGVALGSVPPLAIQTVLVCGALVLVAAMAGAGVASADTLPVAGVFGYAGIRVLPLAQGLLVTLNGIRGRQRSVDELYRDFRALDQAARTPADAAGHLTFAHEIRLDNVSYVYPGTDRPALRDISLSIDAGESLGIVGPTGAGKSTLVDLLLGLLEPAAGVISVDGVPLSGGVMWRRRVGYVPQSLFLLDDTLHRNVALGIRDAAIDDRRVLRALRMSQLTHTLAELPSGLDTRIGERGIRLSGGERQRLAIARALYHDPDLIVFDEATAALDVATEVEVTRAIEALRGVKTTIVVAHRLTTVRDCDRLVWLRDGRIEAIGGFEELKHRSREFRAMATLASL